MSALVDKIRARIASDESGCWVWPGAKVRKGYGVVQAPGEGRIVFTHRAMYEAARGPIPDGMQIDHLCRNTACCNPDHLEAVTPAENTRRGLSPMLARLRRGQKTHCRNGHAYTEENSYFDGKGNRSCRECRRIRHEKWTMLRRDKAARYRTFTADAGNVVSIGSRNNG